MKKSIEYILTDKINTFAKFLNVKTGCLFIAGGAIASLLRDEEPRDYDFWCLGSKVATEALLRVTSNYSNVKVDFVAKNRETKKISLGRYKHIVFPAEIQLLTHEMNALKNDLAIQNAESGGAILFEEDNLKISKYALTVSEGEWASSYQFIFKNVDSPEAITSGFDYEHCKAYFHVHSGLVVPEATLHSIMSSQLKYCPKNDGNPLISLLRMKKFQQRGWRIDRQDVLQMALNIATSSNLDTDLATEVIADINAKYKKEEKIQLDNFL